MIRLLTFMMIWLLACFVAEHVLELSTAWAMVWGVAVVWFAQIFDDWVQSKIKASRHPDGEKS